MRHYLDFEKPVAELEGKIEELKHLSDAGDLNIAEEVQRLQAKADRLLRSTYAKLSAWQKTQVARHPQRPQASDYVAQLVTDFTPLAGDRLYAEDRAILSGLGRLGGRACVVLGQEKGKDLTSRQTHNFGMARPEGYRKAQRLMRLAQRFGLPVITFVDTPGAYPGIGAEERGQAEAIAKSIEVSLGLDVPVIAVVIGEGGSGGAVALASADRVLMLEHAVYSVISPEGCASILWRSADHAKDAAEALRLTAQDLHRLGAIDTVIEEPVGGAHRAPQDTVAAVGRALQGALEERLAVPRGELRQQRRQKFLEMGQAGLG
ncbi:acetyl-CoA carboxylase carboxyl transferase subunit alpha [Leptolyngbya valderiana BDU 20041]|nr:acetyl-CoA carboxylase carboxyl transferase subunit alpha [Leptolyngbya valderiana BDU 20041]